LEGPPGFEPGMEVLQGHPRSFLAIRIGVMSTEITNAQSNTCVDSRASCVALGEIGQDGFAAGTVRAEFNGIRIKLEAVIPYRAPGPARLACASSARRESFLLSELMNQAVCVLPLCRRQHAVGGIGDERVQQVPFLFRSAPFLAQALREPCDRSHFASPTASVILWKPAPNPGLPTVRQQDPDTIPLHPAQPF
jgi:hypothetical protein